MNRLQRKLLPLLALLAISTASYAASPELPEGGTLTEAHVMSLVFDGNGMATMVARPCDEGIGCKNILARIDPKTTWRDSGQLIDYQQAKTLKWRFVLLAIDKHNRALMVNRILTGRE